MTGTVKKGYWILNVEITDPELYGEYREAAAPVVREYHGRMILGGTAAETPEGTTLPRYALVEFPDLKTATNCYHSDGYQKAAEIRMRAAKGTVVIMEGL